MGSGDVFCRFIDFSFDNLSTFSLSAASVLAILACGQQVAVVNDSTALTWEFNGNTVGFPGGSAVKNPYASAGDGGEAGGTGVGFQSLGQKDPLEEEMATHSSILAWGIPWTEEPGGPWSMESWNRI